MRTIDALIRNLRDYDLNTKNEFWNDEVYQKIIGILHNLEKNGVDDVFLDLGEMSGHGFTIEGSWHGEGIDDHVRWKASVRADILSGYTLSVDTQDHTRDARKRIFGIVSDFLASPAGPGDEVAGNGETVIKKVFALLMAGDHVGADDALSFAVGPEAGHGNLREKDVLYRGLSVQLTKDRKGLVIEGAHAMKRVNMDCRWDPFSVVIRPNFFASPGFSAAKVKGDFSASMRALIGCALSQALAERCETEETMTSTPKA